MNLTVDQATAIQLTCSLVADGFCDMKICKGDFIKGESDTYLELRYDNIAIIVFLYKDCVEWAKYRFNTLVDKEMIFSSTEEKYEPFLDWLANEFGLLGEDEDGE